MKKQFPPVYLICYPTGEPKHYWKWERQSQTPSLLKTAANPTAEATEQIGDISRSLRVGPLRFHSQAFPNVLIALQAQGCALYG